MFDVVVLQMVHQVGTVTFDLFVRGHSTEDDLGEALGREHTEADSTDDPSVLDEGEGFVLGVKHQPKDSQE